MRQRERLATWPIHGIEHRKARQSRGSTHHCLRPAQMVSMPPRATLFEPSDGKAARPPPCRVHEAAAGDAEDTIAIQIRFCGCARRAPEHLSMQRSSSRCQRDRWQTRPASHAHSNEAILHTHAHPVVSAIGGVDVVCTDARSEVGSALVFLPPQSCMIAPTSHCCLHGRYLSFCESSSRTDMSNLSLGQSWR